MTSAPSRMAITMLERVTRGRLAEDDLLILTFHSAPKPAAFAAQLDMLEKRFQFVSGANVLARIDSGAPLPKHPCWITFDDALTSFGHDAWPELRRRAIPATMFVATGFPDRPDLCFWWQRLDDAFAKTARRDPLSSTAGVLPMATSKQRRRAFKTLRGHAKRQPHEQAMAELEQVFVALDVPQPASDVLSWEELRRIAAEGCEMAPHTRSHPMLDQVARDVVDAEIRGSIGDLARELGSALPILAYPSGQFDEDAVAAVAACDLRAAVTTEAGVNAPGGDPLRLRRVNVGPHTDAVSLRLRLALVALQRRAYL